MQMRSLIQIGALVAVAAVMVFAVPQAADADPWKCEAHQYERYAQRDCQRCQQQWLPPGQAMHRGQWIPPGQRKKMDRDRDRYRDGRYMDTRDWRYESEKTRKYDRDGGLIIRMDPNGKIDVDYRKYDR
jgi:hypothetical protein